MATNSIREQIILQVKTVLEGVSAVNLVRRKVIASLTELHEIPFPSFPVVCISAGLPVPLNGAYVKLREIGDFAKVRSLLSINLRTYGIDRESPDTAISSLAEDIWDALYADPTVNSKAEGVRVIPIKDVLFIEPFYRFDMIYEVEYIHDTDNL